MQTIQQQRAGFALTQVQGAASHFNSKQQTEYKSYASALPAMIHINGLGQAAAFYKSKGKGEEDKPHEMLYQLLSDWLTKPNQPYAGANDLIQAITVQDMHQYRLAQAEAQALMDWVKKFAKAYMAGD